MGRGRAWTEEAKGDVMTSPTDVLRDEHRVILRGLVVLESAADRLTKGEALPDGWWERLIRLFRAFADLNHHAKEERHLFPALAKAGVPAEGGPVAVMLAEHAEGRLFIQAMQTAEVARRVEAARGYIRLLRDHIEKENGVLFPLTEAVLEERAVQALAHEFETVEAEQGRDASMGHAEAELERLETSLG
jgi:hemerythrin-like domain-containing protein